MTLFDVIGLDINIILYIDNIIKETEQAIFSAKKLQIVSR